MLGSIGKQSGEKQREVINENNMHSAAKPTSLFDNSSHHNIQASFLVADSGPQHAPPRFA